MAINVGDILASFRVVDEATKPLADIAKAQESVASTLTRLNQVAAQGVTLPWAEKKVEMEALDAAAKHLVTSITAVGGAAKLTRDEQTHLLASIKPLIDGYTTLGVQAPVALSALATGLEKATEATAITTQKAREAESAITGFSEALQTLTRGTASIEEQQVATEKLTTAFGEARGGIQAFNVQVLELSGLNAAQDANDMAAAVAAVGGATALTAEEQQAANAVLQDALEKYQALGLEAPAAVQELAAALQAEAEAAAFAATQTAQAEEQVAKMADLAREFSGLPLAERATDMALAVEQIGGASKLTAAEQARVNGVLEEAIAKYRVMGQEVPPQIQRIADATRQASAEAASGVSKIDLLKGGLLGIAAVASTVIGALTGVAVAIVKLGEHGAMVGDITEQFDKLSEKAGIDTVAAMNALRTATAGTLSDLDLMRATLPLLASGFKGSAEDLGTMAEAARVLSERGMNLTDAFSLVASAMTTGRTRSLALQGVVIDMQGAMKGLKEATQAEGEEVETSASLHVKQQEILRGLKGLVAENGAVLVDFADRTDQARVRFANFYNELTRRISESAGLNRAIDRIGAAFLAAFGSEQETAIDTIMRALDAATATVTTFAVEAIRWFGEIWPSVKALAAVLSDVLLVAWRALVEAMKIVADTIVGVKRWIDSLPQPVKDAAVGLAALTAAIWLLNAALVAVTGTAMVGFITGLGNLLVAVASAGVAILGGGGLTVALAGLVSPLGMVAIAVASVTAALYAGSLAWDLWVQRGNAAIDSANRLTEAQRRMAEASKLVGYAVTSDADAMVILDARAEELREEIVIGGRTWTDHANAAKTANAALGIIAGTGLPAVKAAANATSDAVRLSAAALKKFKDTQDEMSGDKLIADTWELVRAYQGLIDRGFTPTIEAQKRVHKAVEDVIAIYLEAGREIPPKLLAVWKATEEAARGVDRWSRETAIARDEVWKFGQVLDEELQPAIAASANLMTVVFLPAVVKTGGVFDELGNRIGEFGDDAEEGFARAGAAAEKLETSLSEDLLGVLRGIPAVIKSAFTGGADLAGAFNAIFADLGSTLGKHLAKGIGDSLGKTLGKVFAEILPGIGALLGPAIEWLGDKIFKTEGKKVNDLRDAYVAAAGGIDALNAAAQRAGLGIDALDAFLRADTVAEYEAAIKALDASLKALADAAAEFGLTWRDMSEAGMSKGFASEADALLVKFNLLVGGGYNVEAVVKAMAAALNALIIDAVNTGQRLPVAMQPMIDKLVEMGLLSDEARAALMGLAKGTEDATARATAAMQEQFAALGKEYDSLSQSIANEAPEEVMGVIETQTRARMDAIKQEQEALTAAMGTAEEQAKASAQALADALKEIFKDPIKIQIDWDVSDVPEMPEIPSVTVPVTYTTGTAAAVTTGGEAPEAIPGVHEYASYARGTGGFVDFGLGTLAMLHGREAVVPEEDMQSALGALTPIEVPLSWDLPPLPEIPVRPLLEPGLNLVGTLTNAVEAFSRAINDAMLRLTSSIDRLTAAFTNESQSVVTHAAEIVTRTATAARQLIEPIIKPWTWTRATAVANEPPTAFPWTRYREPETPLFPWTSNREPDVPVNFAEGGIGNFGAGTLAMLHGREAIVPLDSGVGGAGGGAGFTDNRIVAELQALRADNAFLRETLNALPRTLSRSMRDVVLMTR